MEPGTLSEKSVLDVVAYILQTNNLQAGTKETGSADELNNITLVRPK
jgi:hypothetical protein